MYIDVKTCNTRHAQIFELLLLHCRKCTAQKNDSLISCSAMAEQDEQPAVPSQGDLNAMLASLNSSTLTPEQLATVRAKLEATKAESEDVRRKDMQDFSMYGLYLPATLWTRIVSQEDNLGVLDDLLIYLGQKLGLRCPSEVTQATLTGLMVARQAVEEQERMMTSSNLRALFLTVKSRVQTRMGKLRQEPLPPGCSYLKVLPSNVADLPEAYAALGLDFAQPATQMANIMAIAREVPLRKTNQKVSTAMAPGSAQDPQQMMQMFMSAFMAMGSFAAMSRPEQGTNLQLDFNQKKKGLPALLERAYSNDASTALPASSSRPAGVGQLALPAPETATPVQVAGSDCGPKPGDSGGEVPVDPKTQAVDPMPADPHAPRPADPKPHAGDPKPAEPVSLEESMAKLQSARMKAPEHQDPAVDKKKPLSPAALKKPSAAFKRPAAAKQKAQSSSPKAPLKVKSKSQKPRTRAESRRIKEEILKTVPKSMRTRFAEGCTSCRWVPLCTASCWEKRGFFAS